ncbi:hypothetical protein [Parasphingorhabdus sp.]|uniref:hypothetical protein n=1 Tax=Parasphingorhabdus sp. TaxID=2709688 RepID=UPI003D27D2F4
MWRRSPSNRISFSNIWSDQLKVLSLGKPSKYVALHWQKYLIYGLLVTWLAGIGRYWDSPEATWWQYAGLGSLAYVFLLSAYLWLVIWPLGAERWTYRNVLVFVTLTSLPALLYAIPVEQFMSMSAAQNSNLAFLAIVAVWRVAMLVGFLFRVAKLHWFAVMIGTLGPLAMIILSVISFNGGKYLVMIMAGLGREPRAEDLANQAVLMLGLISLYAAPFLFAGYLGLIIHRYVKRSAAKVEQE